MAHGWAWSPRWTRPERRALWGAPPAVGRFLLARLTADTASGVAADGGARAAGQPDFEAFVRQHERAILNYLWRMTSDEETAHDLAQEVFFRAWQHYATIGGYQQPRGWLFRVATNLALTHNARRRRAPSTGALLFDGEASPAASDPARRFAESDLVRGVLLRLPAKRRAALVLREVYGLSAAKVAEALGMTEAAVRMALCRAREQFRALYAEAESLP